jgi:hypothetical protein
MDQFAKKMTDFDTSIRQESEIIRRYDEVISEKASKFQLLELKTELEKLFCHIS